MQSVLVMGHSRISSNSALITLHSNGAAGGNPSVPTNLLNAECRVQNDECRTHWSRMGAIHSAFITLHSAFKCPAGSSNFQLPGGVKVARRSVKPHGVGASPTLAANLRKAGRYKLAAPVLKTGSARAEVGALPTPSAKSLTRTERKAHETRHPLSKPSAPSQELQTKSAHPRPIGAEA